MKRPKRNEFPTEEEYQIAARENKIKILQNDIQFLHKKRSLVCPSCDHKNIVKDTVLHLYEYYVQPYSCAGGDYYTPEKYCRFKCINCGEFMQMNLADLDIPRSAFLNIETHKNG